MDGHLQDRMRLITEDLGTSAATDRMLQPIERLHPALHPHGALHPCGACKLHSLQPPRVGGNHHCLECKDVLHGLEPLCAEAPVCVETVWCKKSPPPWFSRASAVHCGHHRDPPSLLLLNTCSLFSLAGHCLSVTVATNCPSKCQLVCPAKVRHLLPENGSTYPLPCSQAPCRLAAVGPTPNSRSVANQASNVNAVLQCQRRFPIPGRSPMIVNWG